MKRTILMLCAFLAAASVSSEEFVFKYSEGSRYRILSTVDEAVYINGMFSHQADIMNKISIEVTDADRGRGFIEATFQTSERAYGSGTVYQWGEDYYSEFWRDELGVYEIHDSFFMPVVRHVPTFPGRDLKPGDTWAADGAEVHDFRTNFGVPDAFHFPIRVNYEYLGKAELDGGMYDLIAIEYTVFHKSRKRYPGAIYPMLITGTSDQLLYWDNREGRPYAYREEFDIILQLSSGDTVEYIGTAEAKVIESEPMDKELIADTIRGDLADSGVSDTEVRIDDEGVTLSIRNIQFPPDSAVLIPSEREKLRRIADILREYPDRDILISGHTALAGTRAGRQQLSEERAQAVGNYLYDLGAVRLEQISTRGYGAERPLAPNDSEENMRKNRRVEITILEN